MAHRKPLGSTFTSTFDWRGQVPEPLDYLVSGAETWYRVVGVEEKANPAKVGLMLERIAKPTGEFHDAVVHTFEWYPRSSKAA